MINARDETRLLTRQVGGEAGHAIEGMPQPYATATVARLVEVANKVQFTVDRTTLLRVVNAERGNKSRKGTWL